MNMTKDIPIMNHDTTYETLERLSDTVVTFLTGKSSYITGLLSSYYNPDHVRIWEVRIVFHNEVFACVNFKADDVEISNNRKQISFKDNP